MKDVATFSELRDDSFELKSRDSNSYTLVLST